MTTIFMGCWLSRASEVCLCDRSVRSNPAWKRSSWNWCGTEHRMPEAAAVNAQTPSTPVLPVRSLPLMLANETAKGLLILRANLGTLIPEIAVLVVFYLFIQFFIGGGRMVPSLYAPSLLGFSAFALSWIVTLKMVARTLPEMKAGTLEQRHPSPPPPLTLSPAPPAATPIEP